MILKLTTLVLSLLFLHDANAVDKKIESTLLTKLNMESLVTVIEPIEVAPLVFTPFAIQGIEQGNRAPTCTLIDHQNFDKKLELVGPSDGQFANCHQNLQKPHVFKVSQNYFAVYQLVIEDPRAVFATNYQVIKLVPNGFEVCPNDEQISSEIVKQLTGKRNLKRIVENVVRRFGC